MLKEKIGVIGAGKIGSAIARGIIRAGLADKESVMASDVSDELRHAIAKDLDIKVTPDNGALCDFAEIIILAVKPQIVDPVAQRDRQETRQIQAAGFGRRRRATGAHRGALRAGSARRARDAEHSLRRWRRRGGFAGGGHATAADLEKVGAILNSFGVGLAVEEKYLDAVTGLSGSGPAYVFLFMEALADGGVQVGLARDVALKLAMQTVYGAARMALESNKHLGELKDEVTSPGGTTIAGLYAMEQNGFRGTVMNAVVSATRRSQELGKGS